MSKLPADSRDVGSTARIPSVPSSVWLARLAWFCAILIVVAAGLAAFTRARKASVPVTVSVDGYAETVYSSRPDVARLLTDLGLRLRPEDRVEPALTTPLTPLLTVTIQRARPAIVLADGVQHELLSHATTVAALLAEAGVRLAAKDEVWRDGQEVEPGTPLPVAQPGARPHVAAGRAGWVGHETPAERLSVHRAVPITVDDGGVPYPIFTTAATIGEALLREQVILYLGDRVQPSLGSAVSAGLRVQIERSHPVLITTDRRTIQTRTRGKTVGDTLVELGVVVSGSDRVTPALPAPVLDNTHIQVVRVLETVLVEQDPIPFESILVPDDHLEIDRQRLDQRGESGEHRRRYKLVYEDGAEVARTLLDDWIAAQPITQVVAYGRQIVSRPLETSEGVFSYWRKVRMLATSYSASTAGVSPEASYYGITRLGWRMRRGIVAVDPAVIQLGAHVYVPGYGPGIAGDTGGAIRARRIDLGYDDHNLELWYGWVDVYLLDPPPPAWQIRYVLPNWPRE